VEEIISIMRKGNWKGVTNKKKFKEEFSEMESMSDCFRLGLNFDFFKNKLRLYQSFESSDIIIASPLGLKLTSSNDVSVNNKKVYDFLSSIEILLIDFAEVFMHQNVDHLEEILTFMNKIPKNNKNIVDISRIRDNVKDDQLQYLRQNIIISHYKSLELEMLIRKYCNNIPGGSYWICEKYENIATSGLKEKEDEVVASDSAKKLVKYEFKMMKAVDDMDIYDYKFNYFTKNVSEFF